MLVKLKILLLGSLRKQLIVGMALAILLVMSLFVWRMITLQEAQGLKSHSAQVSALAESVASSSAVWVASRDYSGLQEIVQGVTRYPDLSYVILLDRVGEVLAHNEQSKIGLYLTDLPQNHEKTVQLRSPDLVEAFTPITLAGNQIGWVRIGIDLHHFNDEVSQIRHQGLAFTLIGVALSTLIAILAGRYLTRRLYAIQQVADAVQTGNSNLRAFVDGNDEAARLALQFNGMLDRLALQEGALRASEAHQRALVAASPAGIWQSDAKGEITFVSEHWGQIAGIAVQAASGTGWTSTLHPDDRARVLAEFAEMIRSSASDYLSEFRFVHSDGRVVWVQCRAVVETNAPGQIRGWIGTITDISERKQAEQALQENTLALARSNAELEQFAYVASHDLRQPLRMVNSYVQLLERILADKLDDSTREMMHFATDGAKRMDQMLVSLLEYSRVGRKGEPMHRLASRGAVDEALHFLAPAIQEAHATVRVSGEWPHIVASPDEFTRLWQNLVGNAVKYRAPGRAPEIEITVTPQADGAGWRFCVADNGIGIDPAQFDRLFKVFQRLHARDQYEGNGIGLAVARKIVERHGGRIWVESDGVGLGSRFCFSLPAPPMEHAI